MGLLVRVGEKSVSVKEAAFRGRARAGAVVAQFLGGLGVGVVVGSVVEGVGRKRVLVSAVDDVVGDGELHRVKGGPPDVEEGVAFNAEPAARAGGRRFAAER